MSRTRWYLAIALAVVGVLLASVPALAVDPPQLTQTITDQTGNLSGGEDRIASAAETLKTETGITFYTLWIPQLDGEDPSQFIDRVAIANNFGDGRNVMFMVSLNDRKDSVWASGLTDIESDELDSIRRGAEERLKAGDFIGSVEAAVVGFKNAEVAIDSPAQPAPQQPATPAEPVDLSWLGTFLVVVIISVVGLTLLAVGYTAWKKRRDKRAAAKAEFDRMEELGKQAHVALMEADECVRQSEQEYAFAETEFGSEEMSAFKTAIDVAKKELQGAFRIGQEIDDDVPESYEERSGMLRDISNGTSGIKKALDAAVATVEHLRDLGQTAAATVETLVKQKPRRAEALTKAQERITLLNQRAKSVVESVASNVDMAEALYEMVEHDLDEARKAVDSGNLAQAAVLVRDVQAALAKAGLALDNIGRLSESLATAEKNLDIEIKAAEAEIARASTASKGGLVSGSGGVLMEAQRMLGQAKAESVAKYGDIIVAYNLALKANSLADKVLDQIRTEQERQQRAVEQAQSQIRAAEVAITQADAYIASNGSTVGRKARNRLSEAQRQYQEARSIGGDIFVAATAAIQANDMADTAYRYARQDVFDAQDAASAASYGGSSYSSGGSYGSSSSGGSSRSSSSSSGGGWGSSSSGGSDDSFSSGSFGGRGSGGSSSGGGW